MFECKIENGKGEVIALTHNETDFQVVKIDGLNPPNANINLTKVAGMDGARFNSAKLETRNLVIYIRLNNDIEENRIRLYRFFATKEWCKFYFKNASRDVFAECYVQTVEVTPFSQKEIMQVSLICPQPYFKDMQEVVDDISKVVSAFSFPFSIGVDSPIAFSRFEANRVTVVKNDSESETGIIIEIRVLNDINNILIRNTVTNETLQINNSNGFVADDLITINTYRGEKSVSLLRNNVKTNLFAMLQAGFTFFQLAMGDNRFTYQIDGGVYDEFVRVEFIHRAMYRGV